MSRLVLHRGLLFNTVSVDELKPRHAISVLDAASLAKCASGSGRDSGSPTGAVRVLCGVIRFVTRSFSTITIQHSVWTEVKSAKSNHEKRLIICFLLLVLASPNAAQKIYNSPEVAQ
jgi:hypothetical protein